MKIDPKIGHYAFLSLLVVILALSFIDFGANITWVTTLAVIFAIVVAVLNITEKETMKTLLAAVVLALAGTGMLSAVIGETHIALIGPLFTNLGSYFLIIGIIVAIKVLFVTGKNR